MVSCILLINLFSIPAHDELSYAFAGQCTPSEGDVPRVASLGDIVRQQYNDYMNGGNGRVFVHGVVAFFAGFRLYYLFDVINTAMWFFFVWLILREGGVRIRNASVYLLGAAIVWWVLWGAETCSMNAAFPVNYLWTATATVGMMALWRRNSGWMVPIAFFYGWSQETFILPMLAALAGGAVLRFLATKQMPWTRRQTVSWLLMLTGACFLCLGPAASGRAGGVLTQGLGEAVNKTIRGHFGLLLLGGVLTLLGAFVWMLWQRRRTFVALVMRAPEWWCYFVAAYGFFCLVGNSGPIRLSMPLVLAGLILLLRERAILHIGPWLRKGFIVGVLTVLLIATGIQIRFGMNNLRMLRLYREDPQGVTAFAALPAGPLLMCVSHGNYNRWHRMFFRREVGHTQDPIFLTLWLYETLYRNPPSFFEQATEVEGKGLYITPRAPKLIVKCGHEPLTAEQARLVEQHFAQATMGPKGWQRLLPGRLRVMFPVEDFHLDFPEDPCYFHAADGTPYTLFVPPPSKP